MKTHRLPKVNNLNAGDWSAAMRFCVYDRDPRRFYRLTDVLFRPQLTLAEDDTVPLAIGHTCTPLGEWMALGHGVHPQVMIMRWSRLFCMRIVRYPARSVS